MAPVVDAPQQYRQPSRKGKKAWRKHVNVSEIQEGLENVRAGMLEGGLLAEKPSDAIFTIDTTGSYAIQKSYNKLHKPLKADQILALRSAIPPINSHKRSRVTDGVIEPSAKKQKRNGISYKEYERLKGIAYGGQIVLKDAIKAKEVPDYDPWTLTSGGIEQDSRFSYLDKPKPIKAPLTLKVPPISLAAGKRSFPAVIKPKAGSSYNPVFQDWDKILVEEGAKEVELERKRIKEAELDRENLNRIAAAQDENEDAQAEDGSAWEGFESECEGGEWLKKRRPERKTPAERNRIKRRKATERQAKLDVEIKKRTRQAHQIRSIARKVDDQAKARDIMNIKDDDASSEEIDDRILRRRKFGKYAIPEAPLELVLPDELQESLRLLKPEGNLLKDRFRNILIRGKIETRRPVQKPRKAKRTFTEKWTYKDFQIPR